MSTITHPDFVQCDGNLFIPTRAFHNSVVGRILANNDTGGPSSTAANLNVDWPDEFVTIGILNSWIWFNGRLWRPGLGPGNDYYPGTNFSPGNVEIRFARRIGANAQMISVYWGG